MTRATMFINGVGFQPARAFCSSSVCDKIPANEPNCGSMQQALEERARAAAERARLAVEERAAEQAKKARERLGHVAGTLQETV